MLVAERRSAGNGIAVRDDPADDGGQDGPIVPDGLVNCRRALGEPGPPVQQRPGFKEWGEIHLRRRATEFDEARDRGLEQRGGISVAEELALLRARHAERETRRHRAETRKAGWRRARVPVLRIGAAHYFQHRRCIGHGQREHRNAIERAAGRDDATRADEAAGRLQPDDVVECRRHSAGTGGVGAERKGNEAGGDGDGRTRARSAGVWRASAAEAGRELIEIGLANQ